MRKEELEYVNYLQEQIGICNKNLDNLDRYSIVMVADTNGNHVEWWDTLRDVKEENIKSILKKYYNDKIIKLTYEIRQYIIDY